MNKKKLLALLMALVMTFSLVPVTAFATENEPALPEASITPYEGDALIYAAAQLGINVNEMPVSHSYTLWGGNLGTAALTKVWDFLPKDTLAEAADSYYANWKCDFTVSFDKPVAANSVGLYGAYAHDPELRFGFLLNEPISADTPYYLLKTAGFGDSFDYYAIVSVVKEFLCSAFSVSHENDDTNITVNLVLYNDEEVKVVNSVTVPLSGLFTLFTVNDVGYEHHSAGLHEGAMTVSGESFVSTSNPGPHFAPENATTYVAQIGDVNYETLQAAFAAANSGDTITLLADVEDADRQFGTNKSMTLDLGGNELTCAWLFAYSDATLTVENGTINGNVESYGIYGAPTVNIASTATVNGYLLGWGNGNKPDDSSKYNTPILNVYGTVYNDDYFAITTNGMDNHNPTINVYEGASVTSDTESAIYMPSGTLNIYGGTITGATAVYQKSGNLNITGGTFRGTLNPAHEYSYYGNGCNATGDAIVIDSCGYPNGAPTAYIKDATIESAHGKQIGYYVYENSTAGSVYADKVYTLSTNVLKGWVTNNGEYAKTIGTVSPVAQIGTKQYPTLESAIEAAQPGATVKLIADIDYSTIYTERNARDYGREYVIDLHDLTLDMNSHTISTINATVEFCGNGATIENGTFNLVPKNTDGSYKEGSYALIIDNNGASADTVLVKNVVCNGGINLCSATVTLDKVTARTTPTKYYAVWAEKYARVTILSGTYTDEQTGGKGVLATGNSGDEVGAKIYVTGGSYNAGNKVVASAEANSIQITGGIFTKDPTDYVADGYEAVAIDNGVRYQVGEIVSTAIAKDTDAENSNTQTTYKASRKVVDENENTIGSSAQDTVKVTLSTPDSTVATNNKLPQYDQEKIVAKALEVSNADNLTVTIDVKHDEPEVDANNTITYEVHPEATVKSGSEPVGTFIVTNDKLADNAVFTIKLPVPAELVTESGKVKVTHIRDGVPNEVFQLTVEGTGDNRYVTISGITSFSQFELAPITDSAYNDDVKFNYTLDLKDSININFYVDPSEASDKTIGSYTVQYLYKGGEWQTAQPDPQVTSFGYRYVVAQCAAKEMTEPVHVRVLYAGAIIKSADYSVKGYCDHMIGESTDQALIALCRSVLDFGAAAQVKFGYNTDNLASDSYLDNCADITINDDYYNVFNGSLGNNVTGVSGTVNLESKTGVVIYLTPESGADLIVQSVQVDGQNMNYTASTVNDRLKITVSGVVAYNLYKPVVITVNDGTVIRYSPLAYAYGMQNSKTVGILCKALFQYWENAKAYFDAHNS